MARFKSKNGGSLDLLLDTMCNTFGGIIMIAILVALIAKQNPISLSPAQRASSEMLERRIAAAEDELKVAKEAKENQASVLQSPASAAVREKQKLEQTLVSLKQEAERISADTTSQANQKITDPGQAIESLVAEQQAMEREAAELRNAVAAQNQNSERLKKRLAELQEQIQKAKDARIVKMRFPKERAKTKAPFSIILKHGRIYPLSDGTGARNTTSIRWEPMGGDSRKSLPIPNAGWQWPQARSDLNSLLRGLGGEFVYVAFYVYPDSFDIFRAVRDEVVSANLEFGVETVPAGNDLIWGSEGSSPPPL